MKKSGYSVQISFLLELYRNLVCWENPETSSERKKKRTGIRYIGEDSGISGDQKKVVPDSGTQRGFGNRKQSEERCTEIQYIGEDSEISGDQKKVVPKSGTPERIREQAANGRKTYRNPVHRRRFGNKW